MPIEGVPSMPIKGIPSMPIKGILFDKDGTLLDFAATWPPIYRVTVAALAGGDAALAARLMAAAGGRDGTILPGSPLADGNTGDIARCWADHLPGLGAAEVEDAVNRVFRDEAARAAVPVAGMADVLGRLRARPLALGIATSDSEDSARAALGELGVLALLDFVAGYDSGHGAKPGPGMVTAFCAAAGLAPGAVAVVGDSAGDLEMGRAAGVGLCIGILGGTGAEADLAPLADHVLDSLAALEGILDSGIAA